MQHKVISSYHQDLQKQINRQLSEALKPRPFIIAAEQLSDLSHTYNYPLQYLLRLVTRTPNLDYTWRPEINTVDYISQRCPRLSQELQTELEKLLKKYRNPKLRLPYPHLAWHNNKSWIKPRRDFPTIGIAATVRPLTTFHATGAEQIHSLQIPEHTLHLCLHIGENKNESFIRTIPHPRLSHSNLFEDIDKRGLEELQNDVHELIIKQKFSELSVRLLTNMNATINALGSTWSKTPREFYPF